MSGTQHLDPRLGTELLGYRIDALVGRGGMGVVYRAYDLRLKRNVALKLIAPEYAEDERFRDSFLAETELAASLEHPDVVPIHDAGEIDGQLYLAMRFVEGTDLKRLLATEAPLDPVRALGILAHVAAALDAAHERGLVHRDVKPSNVLLDEREHPYLADFGLTRRVDDPGSPAAGLSVGTPAYVAPEQIRGDPVDARADQYALACMLHESLTGEPPFRRPSEVALLFAHLEDDPPLLGSAMDPVLARALAKDPDDRYRTCSELVAASRQALGIVERPRPLWSRAPVVGTLAAAVVVAAGLAAFFLATAEGDPRPAAGAIVRIDPATNEAVESIGLENAPSGITAAHGHIWVTNFADASVAKVDPDTSRIDTIHVNGSPTGVAVSQGIVFVVNGPPSISMTLIRASGGSAYDTLALEESAAGFSSSIVAAGRKTVWLADKETWAILRIDPAGGSPHVTDRIRLDLRRPFAELNDIAVGRNALWAVGGVLDPRLWRIDVKTGRVVGNLRLDIAPKRVVEGAGALWVTGEMDDIVLRLDPEGTRVEARIAVGRGASDIAVGAGSVWVVNSLDRTVSRIDPEKNLVDATIPIGAIADEIVVAETGVWVSAGER